MTLRLCCIVVASMATALGACGATPAAPTAEPELATTTAASIAVRRAVARGADAPIGTTVELEARYNPASCECPAFEVQRYGAWVRSGLQPDRSAEASVAALLDSPPATGRSVRLVVDVRPTDTITAGSWTYPVWTVLAVVAPSEAR